MEQISKIEALLFIAGEEGVTKEELIKTLQISKTLLQQLLQQLAEKYLNDLSSALHLLHVGDRYMIATKKEYATVIKDFATTSMSNHLSQAALECLSIIAYKQPITRAEIDQIRGVQSSGPIQKLVARQLITEKDRVDGPGRAILYGTTDYFYDYFGLKTLADLPSVEDIEQSLVDEPPLDLFLEAAHPEDVISSESE